MAEKHIDDACCVDLDTHGKRFVMCSLDHPMCGLKIRELARYIKWQCLLHWHEQGDDPKDAPSEPMLD